jgi:membrane protein YqaA with SNARE-associated domain
MLRRLYKRVMALAEHPRANWYLAGVSFAESSFFPIPPDVLLIPMITARRDKAYMFATICTIASVTGGLLGYAIGALFFDIIGKPVVQFYGISEQVEALRVSYQSTWGMYIILGKGLTPFPYKIVTIASGMAGYNLFMFTILSAITRGARFFIEAWLLRRYGEPVRDFIERRLEWVTTGVALVIISGFVALRYF